MKMENKNIEERIEECLKLLARIKAKVGDERTALAILQEVKKDMRGQQASEDRRGGNGQPDPAPGSVEIPATASQVNYLKRLGVEVPLHLTKRAASALIDEAKEGRRESDSDCPSRAAEPVSFSRGSQQFQIWAEPVDDLVETYWGERDLYGY